MTVVVYGDDALDSYRWVLWRIEVVDPELRGGGDTVAEATQTLMTEHCAALRCVYGGCEDNDSYPDGTRYYLWMVRVPRAEQQRKNGDGVPVAVEQLQAMLRQSLPAGLDDWSVHADVEHSYRMAVGDYLREAYADLLDPIEAALLPWRRDGAESLDPQVHYYGTDLEDGTVVGHAVIWLSTDPPGSAEFRPWLVLYVGVVPDRLPSAPARNRQLAVHTPVLLGPRPHRHSTWTWMASIDTSGFGDFGNPDIYHTRPAHGARYQWHAPDPAELVELLTRDLRALYPTLVPTHRPDGA